jgi:hypothetical protein
MFDQRVPRQDLIHVAQEERQKVEHQRFQVDLRPVGAQREASRVYLKPVETIARHIAASLL